MDKLQCMRLFSYVAEHGSFTSGGQHMSATTPQVSRAIATLESHLRTRLLNRSTRRVTLTEAGQRYFQHCLRILADVDQAEAEARSKLERASGTLKVHAMSCFGQHYVVPAIAKYLRQEPAVSVDLKFSQTVPDLLSEGFDVSIVLAPELPPSEFVCHRLGSVHEVACASPEYLEEYGYPHTLSDLRQHTCIRLSTPVTKSNVWRINGSAGSTEIELGSSVLSVNTAEAMEAALSAGVGIGVLPTASALPVLRSGKLVRVLASATLQDLNLYVLYPSRKYLDAKIRTWVEFLREEMPAMLARDDALLDELTMCDTTAVD